MLKQNYNQNLSTLQHEINMLRSLVIGTIGKDKEGNYNPSFVKKIIKVSQKKPTHDFQNKRVFLKQLGLKYD